MALHPKTTRLLTEWLTDSAETHTDVPDFSALHEPGALDHDDLFESFPMLQVRRLVLSHASSRDVLHVAQDCSTGDFLAVVVHEDDDQGRSVAQSHNMQNRHGFRA